MPEASIVVRAFNEEKHIGNLLRGIRQQSYRDYEIILVDSGSTDDTLNIAESYCDKIVEIESRDFTYGYSINVGCRNGNGNYFVIISAHAMPVNEQWLGKLVSPFQDNAVAMVYGRHIGSKETKYSENRDFARIFHESPLKRRAPDYYANNANSALRASLWHEEPFDEYLTGLEDIAWAQHFMDKGYFVIYQPESAVYHIHDESWRQVYNRYRREALAANRIGLSHPPHGRKELRYFVSNLLGDITAAPFSSSGPRLGEIFQFRYHQWRGARDGWKHDIDLKQERYDLFYSGANRGVVITGRHSGELRDLPMPEMRPGDVLIKVMYAGVCQVDLDVHDGELEQYGKGLAKYPIVPGHEFSGEVVHVGANSTHLRPGDRVVGEGILSCGNCSLCQSGAPTACPKVRELGISNCDGAYARFLSLPARYLHKIPEKLDLVTACLTEPLAAVHKGLRRIAPFMQDGYTRCAVIGAGPIGNFMAQTLTVQEYPVVVFDNNLSRLGYLQAKMETRPNLDGLEQFNLIVEATGKTEVLRQVLNTSRAGTAVLLLGSNYGNITYNFVNLACQERVVVGSIGSTGEDFKWALDMLQEIDTAPLTQAILPLEEYAKAWSLHRSASHLKVILKAD